MNRLRLKHQIAKRQTKQSKHFVAVFVDGDRPAAQKIGARFRVSGYPTMVLFTSEGREITRLPGEADAPQVLSLLEAGLAGGPAAQGLGIGEPPEELRGDFVHPLIGALGRQDGRNHQLVNGFISQRGTGARVMLSQQPYAGLSPHH